MRLVIDFISRLRVSPVVQHIDSEPATGAPESPAVDDSAIAAKVAAIFAPIMASLDRIEKYVDTLPDKVIDPTQV
jgi:hypothetical protein